MNHKVGMDMTITNDYTPNSMLKGCDEVIDMINKLFGTQEVVRNTYKRKTEIELLSELGISRIEAGASRVENCELFNPEREDDLEK